MQNGFLHQGDDKKGRYEEIGKKIGQAIDRYIDSFYFDSRTRLLRDEDVSSNAVSVKRVRVTIDHSGCDSVPLKDRERFPWMQIIALLDIADGEYANRDIPARLDEIKAKNREIISAGAAEGKLGR